MIPTEILQLNSTSHNLNLELNGMPSLLVIDPNLANFAMNVDVPNLSMTDNLQAVNLGSLNTILASYEPLNPTVQ